MMCNPNIMQSGAEPNGSKTGNWQQNTSQFQCELELWEKSCRGIRAMILDKQEKWLASKMEELGMPRMLLEGIRDREPGMLRLATHWVKINGLSFGTRDLNTIQLYQYGELIYDEELFKITYEAPTCH